MVVTGISGGVLTSTIGVVLTCTSDVVLTGTIGVVLTSTIGVVHSCTRDVVLTGTIGVVLTSTSDVVLVGTSGVLLTGTFMSEHHGWPIVSGLHCDTTDREAMIEVSSKQNLTSPITNIIFNFTTWNNLTVYNYCTNHSVKILLVILCWI